MVRRVDRPRVERGDGRAEPLGEAVGEPAGEVELLARALRREHARPRSRPSSSRDGRRREDAGRHPPAEVELLGAGDGEQQDRRAGAQRDERRRRSGTARSGRPVR